MSPAVLRRLEAVVNESRERFVVDLAGRLRTLRAAVQELIDGNMEQRDLLSLVFDESLQIKGMGGTIGYNVLSLIATTLNDFVTGRTKIGRIQFEILQLHIDAMYVVIADRITDNGGILEDQVLSGLRTAVRKFG
ncbi:Hpt domain-containing protein [Nisaea acidiphila]|uniref:Hpt domain-containing protein n=1 Tax=Nisaea acidiphila TaxID=1862145 RepID=A0A9J7AXA7_9PROT|nr:Hpt domain-containing protein [Nisaea acidiphila]UUX51912.1 Hpt domain-containing protein [Nisaea acidiphila]